MSMATLFSLLGGIGLFLYGMTIMSTGLKQAAGDNLRLILKHATKNKYISVVVGIVVTLLVQSSSATDVMVIGFVNSELMSLAQAIGVIMGANIGTTVTAQLTAFNLGTYAPLILFIGGIMFLFMKKDTVRHIGLVILGFGMLFQGISIMKAAIVPLSQSAAFINFLTTLTNPVIAVIFGVAFTALVQSSSSSIVIFQAFAVQGLLTYEMTVYLVIGAAIGSVTPNILASLTANRNGKRTAVLNLVFNLIRAAILLILITLIPQILALIQSLSPGDVARQVANTHTIFATFAVIVLLPFSNIIVKIAQTVIPVRPEETRKQEDRKLQYMELNEQMPPAVAIEQARREIARMGRIARDNLEIAIEGFFNNDEDAVARVETLEETVNILNDSITKHLVHMRRRDMTARDLAALSNMTLVVADIERISDHAENIIEYSERARKEKAVMSEEAVKELKLLAQKSLESVDFCLKIFSEEKYDLIDFAEKLEQEVDDMQDTIVDNHVRRLMDAKCDPLGGVIFTDMASDLERCSDHAINVACAMTGGDKEK